MNESPAFSSVDNKPSLNQPIVTIVDANRHAKPALTTRPHQYHGPNPYDPGADLRTHAPPMAATAYQADQKTGPHLASALWTSVAIDRFGIAVNPKSTPDPYFLEVDYHCLTPLHTLHGVVYQPLATSYHQTIKKRPKARPPLSVRALDIGGH
jgi:hypothetical protein